MRAPPVITEDNIIPRTCEELDPAFDVWCDEQQREAAKTTTVEDFAIAIAMETGDASVMRSLVHPKLAPFVHPSAGKRKAIHQPKAAMRELLAWALHEIRHVIWPRLGWRRQRGDKDAATPELIVSTWLATSFDPPTKLTEAQVRKLAKPSGKHKPRKRAKRRAN